MKILICVTALIVSVAALNSTLPEPKWDAVEVDVSEDEVDDEAEVVDVEPSKEVDEKEEEAVKEVEPEVEPLVKTSTLPPDEVKDEVEVKSTPPPPSHPSLPPLPNHKHNHHNPNLLPDAPHHPSSVYKYITDSKPVVLSYSLPPDVSDSPASHTVNETNALVKLCLELLHDPESCQHLYELCHDEEYLRLTWEITYRIFFERPFGIVLFVLWTIMLCVLNFVILFLCTLLKPLRSVLLTKIVSDLRRRYYFTNDSELRVVDNNIKK